MAELNRDFLVKKFGSEDRLKELTRITLNNNKIRKINSNAFKGLEKLETILLYHNEIEEIDFRSFENLSNLKVLNLNNNKLKRIGSNTLKGLTKLERLILQDNLIEEINGKAFETLTDLREIELNNNKLRRIDTVTFRNLNKLVELKLDHNEIEVLDGRIFDDLSNLKALWLNNNKLKCIDKNCFKSLKSIEILKLSDNDNDLNALSFVRTIKYDKDKLDQNEYISDWNEFLEHIHIIYYKFHSPKLLIVDYYDSLINEIDIYTEEILEKYTENDVLPDEPKVDDLNDRLNHERSLTILSLLCLLSSSNVNFKDIENDKYQKFFEIDSITDPYKEEYKYNNDLIDVKSKKLHDYVNQVRSKSIEEINKVREENLQQYEINRDKLKYDRNDLSPEKVEEMRRELFKEKFCFLLKMDDICGVKIPIKIPIKYITITTDFYLDFFSRYKLIGFLKSNLKVKNSGLKKANLEKFLQLLAKYISKMLEMQVYGNEVISITEDKLLNIKRLKNIDIQIFNERGSLEMSIKNNDSFDFTSLKSLDVVNMKPDFEKQLSDLSALKNLEYLYINNAIIDREVFNDLNKLVKLELNSCRIEKLTPNVTNNPMKITDSHLFKPSLKNLQILEIDRLDLKINLESLENLKIVILHLSKEKELDFIENFGTKLTGLSISCDYNILIEDIDKMNLFFKRHNFSNVCYLRLHFGRHFNSDWLNSFTNLKRLSLSSCDLKDNLDFLQSENLSQLEFLDLSNNHITTIPKGTLSKLKSLKHLDISRNYIDFGPKTLGLFNYSNDKREIFYGLINLETLDISKCRIQYIDPEVFSNTPKLNHINLQNNSCKLDESKFCYLKNLKKIELSRLQFELYSIDLDILSRSNNIEIAISNDLDLD